VISTVADDLLDPGSMIGDHRSTQEILDADSTNAVGVDASVEQVLQRRHGTNVELERKCAFHGPPNGASGGARHRDQEMGCVGFGNGSVHRGQAAVHTQAGHVAADEAGVVVEEAHRPNPGPRVPECGASKQCAGLASPVEQRPVALALLEG
jgi:hypothetical protein